MQLEVVEENWLVWPERLSGGADQIAGVMFVGGAGDLMR